MLGHNLFKTKSAEFNKEHFFKSLDALKKPLLFNYNKKDEVYDIETFKTANIKRVRPPVSRNPNTRSSENAPPRMIKLRSLETDLEFPEVLKVNNKNLDKTTNKNVTEMHLIERSLDSNFTNPRLVRIQPQTPYYHRSSHMQQQLNQFDSSRSIPSSRNRTSDNSSDKPKRGVRFHGSDERNSISKFNNVSYHIVPTNIATKKIWSVRSLEELYSQFPSDTKKLTELNEQLITRSSHNLNFAEILNIKALKSEHRHKPRQYFEGHSPAKTVEFFNIH